MVNSKEYEWLFDVNVPAINKHLNNIYEEKELNKNSIISKMEIVWKEENKNVNRELEFYNLDAIIAVGYRVNSKKATKFRICATQILKDYMIKRFVIDVDKMKNGPKFGKELCAKLEGLKKLISESIISERKIEKIKIWDYYLIYAIIFNLKDNLNKDVNSLYNSIKWSTCDEIFI